VITILIFLTQTCFSEFHNIATMELKPTVDTKVSDEAALNELNNDDPSSPALVADWTPEEEGRAKRK
jgi:hypothetical protein